MAATTFGNLKSVEVRYQVVVVPKYQKKKLYGKVRTGISEIVE